MKTAATLGLGLALLSGGIALAQPTAAPAAPPAADARPDRGSRGEGSIRMFELIDVNRDGRVVWDEAWVFVTTRFNAADADRSGGLSLEEFAALRMRQGDAPGPRPEYAQRMEQMRGMMFRGLDADRNGQVTLVEIRPMVEARFRALDANGDNAVSRDEVPQRGPHQHRGPRPGGPDAPPTPPAR
ncbi:EF-hand domain-containing protein [Roseococcus sp. SDR]|uniref:EF-hand domain-containing protein n=1 Tax=Roseococcus sp. SDR TaxID=2835532 RepID=UPI001BCB1404|nr:EF-hand domain-containing protein [Roseococcus sp. SDR]MBS7789517.1 EF-hand domain-containing protein [Roseococcus sp. SDR]MBV1844831.1 EF-hand domain-containing protein [Roseococcus sp. SDR]